VSQLKVIEKVFLLRDNVNKTLFSDKTTGEPIDFSGTNRMVLSFAGSAIVADTDVDADLIDYSQTEGTGVIVFDLGSLLIVTAGELAATLIAYDPVNTAGQIVTCASDEIYYFEFVTC
jgi:hypothetical protein